MMAEKIDEFIAYMTAIDAALGLHGDHKWPKPDPHKGIGATDRMKYRMVGLLDDVSAWDDFDKLFNIRSAYVHGRRMGPISTDDQVLARSMARRVIETLITAAAGAISQREIFLDDLLNKGKKLRHP